MCHYICLLMDMVKWVFSIPLETPYGFLAVKPTVDMKMVLIMICISGNSEPIRTYYEVGKCDKNSILI